MYFYHWHNPCKQTLIHIADGLILKFYNSEETLYGKDAISLNMHLRNHLEVVILHHGPVTSFSCFSFERSNELYGQ